MMYLLKFLLASTLLYGIYYFLLRNETTFKFNRFYLLSILAVAAIIPLVIIKTTIIEAVAVAETPVVESTYQVKANSFPLEDTAYSSPLEETEELETSVQINWPLVGKATYGAIALLLLLRFFLNLRSIHLLRKTGEEITFKRLPLIQSSKVKTTFSFLNKVFVNRTLFKQQGLADEILEHEAVHIKQKHSLDIIFMELVACFIWFNPVVYFIRRNIKLNHEYLADAGVLKHSKDPNAYQMLLLKHSSKQLILNPLLASHLSYGETKQRFKIMFKTTNKRVAALKQLTALALITGLFFAMGEERVIAQDQETASEQKVSFDVPPPPPPVQFRLTPKTQIRFEYANGDVVKGEYGKLSGRNKEIFESPEGKGEIFIPRVTYLRIPDKEMLDKYADTNKYRIWIDGKEIDANELSSYNPKDFNDYYITPFGESEKEFGKLSSKVEFLTPDYKREKEAELPKGTWAPYHPIMKPSNYNKLQVKEVKQETTKKQKVVAKITGRVIDPKNQKVRFINSKGEKVEKKYEDLTATEKARFDEPEAKGEIFLPPPPPAYITDEMMDEFQNPKEYGVWIDGKRVENSVLANYSAKDFHHYGKSRLYKGASHFGQYTYQLNLYSQAAWEKDGNSNGTWFKHRIPKKVKSQAPSKGAAQLVNVKDVKRPKEVVEVKEEERAAELREINEERQPIEVIEIKEEKQSPEVIEVREEEQPIEVIEVKEEKRALEVESVREEKNKNSFKIPKEEKDIGFMSPTPTGEQPKIKKVYTSAAVPRSNNFQVASVSDKRMKRKVRTKADQQDQNSDSNERFIDSIEANQLVRFKNENDELIEKEMGDLSQAERELYAKIPSGSEVFLPLNSNSTMSQKEWNGLTDTAKYGVWINGDKVANASLADLSPEDIFKYDIRNGKYMKNLGDFEFQYFALTKDFVEKKYAYKDRYGFWTDLKTHISMLKQVESMSSKKN